MDKLYAPQNIIKFSDCLVAAVNSQDDDRLDTLLNVLKVLISGPPGERCQSFYGSRVPTDRCLAAVLSSPDLQTALIADAEKCKKLVDALLGLPYLTSHHCRALGFLLQCTPASSDLRRHLIGRILAHDDLYKFELKTISSAVEEDTSELEMSLITLCTQEPTTEQVLARFDHWIKWCARSSFIFQILTGILQQLLKHLKCKTRVLACIDIFVKLVQKTCDQSGIDFVSLYPCEVHTAVGLLIMKPSSMNEEILHFIRNEVQTKMSYLQKKDPSTALLLISHFPEWADLL